jgi:hypothetical protein
MNNYDYNGTPYSYNTYADKKKSPGFIVGVIISLLILIGASVGGYFAYRFSQEQAEVTLSEGVEETMVVEGPEKMTLAVLGASTDGIYDENLSEALKSEVSAEEFDDLLTQLYLPPETALTRVENDPDNPDFATVLVQGFEGNDGYEILYTVVNENDAWRVIDFEYRLSEKVEP